MLGALSLHTHRQSRKLTIADTRNTSRTKPATMTLIGRGWGSNRNAFSLVSQEFFTVGPGSAAVVTVPGTFHGNRGQRASLVFVGRWASFLGQMLVPFDKVFVTSGTGRERFYTSGNSARVNLSVFGRMVAVHVRLDRSVGQDFVTFRAGGSSHHHSPLPSCFGFPSTGGFGQSLRISHFTTICFCPGFLYGYIVDRLHVRCARYQKSLKIYININQMCTKIKDRLCD